MTPKTYAQLFQALRKDLKLNQAKMAERLRCAQGTVSRIEESGQTPSLRIFERAYAISWNLSETAAERMHTLIMKNAGADDPAPCGEAENNG